MDTFGDIVLWYAATTLVSLAFTPLVLVLFRNLTDRGAAFARIFSALVLVWPVWFLAGIIPGVMPFGALSLWGSLVIIGGASWWFAIRNRAIDRDSITHVAFAEAGYLVMFAGYVWFRGYDPVIQWQEKLSDLMMLSSTMQSTEMPPADAWLSGNTINYYYVGYVPWAGLGKMTGIDPAIVYNLALASVFAATVLAAIGVAANVLGRFYSLTMARLGGGLAAAFLVFMATPWAAITAWNDRDTIADTGWFQFFWPASRQFFAKLPEDANPEAITEFPAFSFQLGDLHPHVLALPVTLLSLGLAWTLAILPNDPAQATIRAQWGRLAIAGGVAGGLFAMNSWDLPAYLLLTLVAFVVGSSAWASKARWQGIGIILLSAIVPWLPFHLNFESPVASTDTGFANAVENLPVIGGVLASLASWYGDPTSLGQYTGLLGFTYVIALALIGWEFWQHRDAESDPLATRLALVFGGLLLLIGLLVPVPMLLLAGLPVVLVLLLWQRNATLSPGNVALGLFGLGFALTLIPEFVYLSDIFNNRMNTVFKFYYQAWTMFAIAAAIGVIVLWQGLRRIPVAQLVLAGGVAVMLVGGVGASAVGAYQWTNWRGLPDGWHGMDGLMLLEEEAGWEGEHDAISWLVDNGSADDVMLTAGGCEWSLDVGTTAAGSGVPTILGWPGHEGQWHLGQDGFPQDLETRATDITTMWETLDPALLDKYEITLLYMGPIEQHGGPYRTQQHGPTCVPGPFANATDPAFPGEGWTEVYTNDDGVRIFRRNDA